LNYIEQSKRPWRNLPGLLIVIGAHIVLIYALVFVLGRNVIDRIAAPIETKIIKEEKPPPPPPPPQAYVPPPEVVVQPPPTQTNAIQAVQTQVKPSFTPPRPVQTAPDTTFSAAHITAGPRDPGYPAQYEDSGRTGRVAVDCEIETDGRPSGCKILSTSGGPAFATQTMNWLENQGVRYRPETVGGVPRASRHQWVVTFQAPE
jgi:protein TonB